MNTKKKRIIILIVAAILWLVLSYLYSVEKEKKNYESDNGYSVNYSEASNATGVVKEFDITASQTTYALAEGIEIDGFTYNGEVPGPELRVELGDTVRVNFTNDLPQETTIHWHGVRVPNAMDGVPGVTQDPIQPGESFVYEFTPKDAGTFWYHPHVRTSEQVERGLYGTLIVEDPADPEYSQDVTWVVDDWRITETGELNEAFNTNHDLMHDGRWGNVITVNGSSDEQLSVKPGERIRLRLVNVSNGRVYTPDFSRLDAALIAVDGMKVAGVMSANGFELAPGNRIDVDISIPQTYAGKTIVITDTYTRNINTLGKIVVGDMGDTVATPDFEYPIATDVSSWVNATNEPVDYEYVLDAERTDTGIVWTMNGEVYPNGEIAEFEKGEFVKIRFTNNSGRLHPMHLHGQFFKVLAKDGALVNEGYLRDTVLVNGKETVDVGMVPLDEGTWANHCHILEHAESGMVTAITVK